MNSEWQITVIVLYTHTLAVVTYGVETGVLHVLPEIKHRKEQWQLTASKKRVLRLLREISDWNTNKYS